ncbi:MAG: flagellar type III secretion system pore protein FliP [Angelakisella sp.]
MSEVAQARARLKKQLLVFGGWTAVTALLVVMLMTVQSYAAGITVDFTNAGDGTGALGTLEILFLFVILAMAPSILLMMTSFTRIVIVISFLRNALGTQQSPPNQIIIGLAMFLSLFVMMPVLGEINTTAYQPYKAGTITQEQAVGKAVLPIKQFMLRQTDKKSVNLFLTIANRTDVQFTDETAMETLSGLGLEIIVPAFITSELTKAFTIGFLIFLPFLIIDMVVSSVLMSMGMVMLPPAMIALPFKILMFLMVDGWSQLMGILVRGFH